MANKSYSLDNKSVFRDGLFKMREALEVRFYVSVAPFARDLALVLARVIGMSGVANTTEVETKIDEDRNTKKDLTQEEKEIRKLAKRITRAIQPALDDASRKEAELCRRPYEEDLQDLGQMLDKNMAGSVVSSREELEANDAPFLNGNLTNGVSQLSTTEPMDLDKDTISASDNALDSALQNHIASGSLVPSKHSSPQFQLTPASDDAALGINDGRSNTTPRDASPSKPPTPPMSAGGDLPTPLSLGGIPWYMEPFDPAGTTIFEERWTGRDVQRAMSDELSDINEDDLSGLIDGDMDMDVELEEQVHVAPGTSSSATGTNPNSRKKNGKLKKRWRGFR